MTESHESENFFRKYRDGIIFISAILGFIFVFIAVVNLITPYVLNTSSEASTSSTPQAATLAPVDQQPEKTSTENGSNAQIQSLQQRVSDLELQLKSQQQEIAKTQNQPSLPDINKRAIVFIVCVDGYGTVQTGSGTIISPDGFVITNKHVVTSTDGATLTCGVLLLYEGSTILDSSSYYKLSLNEPGTGFYGTTDAVKLKITARMDSATGQTYVPSEPFPFLTPSTLAPKVGDQLFIFGYPSAAGFSFNVTKGIVSSFSQDGTYMNTDAVIDHGNSGGAAVTSDGLYVGIPTSKYVANNDYLGQVLTVSDFYYVH